MKFVTVTQTFIQYIQIKIYTNELTLNSSEAFLDAKNLFNWGFHKEITLATINGTLCQICNCLYLTLSSLY